jgi:HTH-type transcriptional regulator / antitoxin HigA
MLDFCLLFQALTINSAEHINPKAYGTLLARIQPHIIRTEKEYNEALALVEELMHNHNLTPEENELLELLVALVEKYEAQQHPVAKKSTPIERLQFLMEANALKQADLVSIFGSRGTTSEVLNGKRKISQNAAIKLGERFNLPPTLFMV